MCAVRVNNFSLKKVRIFNQNSSRFRWFESALILNDLQIYNVLYLITIIKRDIIFKSNKFSKNNLNIDIYLGILKTILYKLFNSFESTFANDASDVPRSNWSIFAFLLCLATYRFERFYDFFRLCHEPNPKYLFVTPIFVVRLKKDKKKCTKIR